jgi:hypothetical protein
MIGEVMKSYQQYYLDPKRTTGEASGCYGHDRRGEATRRNQ